MLFLCLKYGKEILLSFLFLFKSNLFKLKNRLIAFFTKVCFLFIFVCLTSGITAQIWEQVNDAPFRDDHTNSFGYDGNAYIFRGSPTNNGSESANEVWTYTPATDTWNLMTTFPGDSRRISIGDDWDDKYYYGFGIGGPDGLLDDLWVFDPVDTSFTELPSCPGPGRSHPSLIAHNGKVFMGAGSSFGGDLNDWWEYDIATQEWSQKQNIPGPVRHHMFHFSIGKYIYVGGGHVANWNRYDPETEEWTPIDDLPQGRVAGTQFNYNNLGFILGGDDRFHNHVPDFETFMYYSEETKEWDYLPPLPNGSRWAPSSFIVDDELFFAAGLSTIVNGGDQTMWKFDLTAINCLPATGLNAIDVDDVSAGLFWSSNSSGNLKTLFWRKVGENIWNIVNDPVAVYQLDNLEVCQEYEFRIVTSCGSNSFSSDIFTFKTDGCCVNPDILFTAVTPNSAIVEWAPITAADEYNIRWKATDGTDWTTALVEDGPYQLINLLECTEYEFQIESICMIEDIDFSESHTFLTRDCGACLDETYCSVEESFEAEFVYINKVQINDFVNISGNNGGYGNFEGAQSEEIIIGDSFTFTFEPGFQQGSFAFSLLGWIDLNSNGVFEDSEKLIQQNSVVDEITLEIVIPIDAVVGTTRMRIYYSNEVDPCSPDDAFVFGEAEDYCIVLKEEPTATIELGENELVAYPNPFQNTIVLEDKSKDQSPFDVRVVNLVGETVQCIKNFQSGEAIKLNDNINAGVYFLIVERGLESMEIRIVKQD
jgi:hypothetical protein